MFAIEFLSIHLINLHALEHQELMYLTFRSVADSHSAPALTCISGFKFN